MWGAVGAAPALHKGGGSAGARGPARPARHRPRGGAAPPCPRWAGPARVPPELSRCLSPPVRLSGRSAPREGPERPPAPERTRGSVSRGGVCTIGVGVPRGRVSPRGGCPSGMGVPLGFPWAGQAENRSAPAGAPRSAAGAPVEPGWAKGVARGPRRKGVLRLRVNSSVWEFV